MTYSESVLPIHTGTHHNIKYTYELTKEMIDKYKGKYRIVYAANGIDYIIQEKLVIFWITIWQRIPYIDFPTITEAEDYIDNLIRWNEIIEPQRKANQKRAGKIVKYYP